MATHREADDRPPEPGAILEFWFGDAGPDGFPDRRGRRRWFAGGPAMDRRIRERFEPTVAAALAGYLHHWTGTPEGRLALVLALDQFPRHIHRGTPAAFTGDASARAVALAGIERGDDRALATAGRLFLYMPLQHAEDLASQDRCVALVRSVYENAAGATRQCVRPFVEHARGHREIIARFGRFPHRNAVLGRDSTPEERAWLARNRQGFGQR